MRAIRRVSTFAFYSAAARSGCKVLGRQFGMLRSRTSSGKISSGRLLFRRKYCQDASVNNGQTIQYWKSLFYPWLKSKTTWKIFGVQCPRSSVILTSIFIPITAVTIAGNHYVKRDQNFSKIGQQAMLFLSIAGDVFKQPINMAKAISIFVGTSALITLAWVHFRMRRAVTLFIRANPTITLPMEQMLRKTVARKAWIRAVVFGPCLQLLPFAWFIACSAAIWPKSGNPADVPLTLIDSVIAFNFAASVTIFTAALITQPYLIAPYLLANTIGGNITGMMLSGPLMKRIMELQKKNQQRQRSRNPYYKVPAQPTQRRRNTGQQ
eukprot:TRINITY_DN7319_c0_g1_i1.p1 TRINITY_DN7319_c0_g1~~TRINITY_DN7319_c0_g1_i1.p1  ORF type:complete len:342 (-),score=18.52 TRINITY_DN7319_c0_g1_i1:4-972(-)